MNWGINITVSPVTYIGGDVSEESGEEAEESDDDMSLKHVSFEEIARMKKEADRLLAEDDKRGNRGTFIDLNVVCGISFQTLTVCIMFSFLQFLPY